MDRLKPEHYPFVSVGSVLLLAILWLVISPGLGLGLFVVLCLGTLAALVMLKTQPAPPEPQAREQIIQRMIVAHIDPVLGESPSIATRTARTAGRAADEVFDLPISDSDERLLVMFKTVGYRLLLTGAAGAGKSMLLLRLARLLLLQAARDERLPIPIIFDLAYWRNSLSLVDWMIDELSARYGLMRDTAADWVQNDRIAPLFDGLADVNVSEIAGCCAALNNFLKEKPKMPVVVTDRGDAVKFPRHNRFELQPLTVEQVEDYLTTQDETALLAAIGTSNHLRTLASNPLTLTLLEKTYHGKSPPDIPEQATFGEQRNHLVEQYVESRFDQVKKPRYHKDQTIRSLKWLARIMRQRDMPRLGIQNINHTWLDGDEQHQQFLLRAGPPLGIVVGLVIGLVMLLLASIAYGIGGALEGILVGLVAGGMYISSRVRRVETLQWQRDDALRNLQYITAYALPFGFVTGILIGLVGGALAAVTLIAFIGFKRGLQPTPLLINPLPNGPIRGPLRHLRFFAMLHGAVLGIAFGLGLAIGVGSIGALIVGLLFGALGGVALTLVWDIRSLAEHIAVRRLISKAAYVPSNLADFLNYTAELQLMVKVGGDYRFLHDVVFDYFAAEEVIDVNLEVARLISDEVDVTADDLDSIFGDDDASGDEKDAAAEDDKWARFDL